MAVLLVPFVILIIILFILIGILVATKKEYVKVICAFGIFISGLVGLVLGYQLFKDNLWLETLLKSMFI